ncbi:MAG: Spy/CpxP family protein refolding chaperone [Candidatus Saccharicenans sp.]
MSKKLMVLALMAVLLVSFTLVQAGAQPMRRLGQMGPGYGPGFQVLKDALQLTPEQEKKLEEFRKARLEEAKAFQEKMLKMRQEFRKLMTDPKADQKKLESMIDEMAKMRAERMKTFIKNREEWRKIFTPEQLKKLDDYRKDFALRNWMRRGRGGRMIRPLGQKGMMCPGCWR